MLLHTELFSLFSMQTTEDASLVTEQHCFKCMVISYYYDYVSLLLERDRINKGNYCQPERGTSSRISGDLSLSRFPAAFIFLSRREVSVNCSAIRNMRYLSLQRIYHQLCVGAGSLPHGTIIR